MALNTQPNLFEPGKRYFQTYSPGDDFYEALIDSHQGLSDEQSLAVNARLADTPEGRWLAVPSLALLALASLVMLGLTLATLRGLRAGTLLVPEGPPVIPIRTQPSAA